MADIIVDRRLVKTFFSKKPTGQAWLMTIGMLMVSGLLTLIYWSDLPLAQQLAANRDLVFNHHQYWRLLTTTFVHGDPGHFFANAYMMGILSFFVFTYFGAMVYPIGASLLAAAVNALTISYYPAELYLVGASGLVYLLAGFWLTMFIFIERRRSILRRLLIAGGVGLFILTPSTFAENVSYLGHFNGFCFGVALAALWFARFWRQIRQHEVWQTVVDRPEDDPQLADQSPSF